MSLTKVTYAMIEGTPVNVLDFGAVGDGVTNDTVAIQAALDATINLGFSNTDAKTLYFPSGKYLVTSLSIGGVGGVTTKDAYNKTIVCEGEIFGTNASGKILEIEGVYQCAFYGLNVTNLSTAVSSFAAKATRSYAANFYSCLFNGGEYALQLQGNLNNFFGCFFNGASRAGFAMLGASADNLVNNGYGCGYENNTGYGIEINRTSGSTPFDFINYGGYFESNDLGHVRIYNNLGNVSFESCYFAMNDTLIDGIIYGGTITTVVNNKSRIENCTFVANSVGLAFNCVSREAGTAASAVGGISYAGNRLLGNTNANTVFGFTQAASGSANSAMEYSFNRLSQNPSVSIKNFDFSTLSGGAGSAPTDWTASGGATITSTTTISEYGYGNAIVIDSVFAYQLLTIKPYTLYKISCYAKTSAGTSTAGMQIWDAALANKLWDSPTTTATTAVLLEGYWFSGSNTSVNILTRETSPGAGDVIFSEVRMIDQTN